MFNRDTDYPPRDNVRHASVNLAREASRRDSRYLIVERAPIDNKINTGELFLATGIAPAVVPLELIVVKKSPV